MEPLALGAVVSLIVGAATAVGAFVGKRGENRVNHSGVVLTGYGGLVDNLHKEIGRLEEKLREKETELSAAYAELARERADKAGLLAQIATLTNETQQLREQLAALGGDTQ